MTTIPLLRHCFNPWLYSVVHLVLNFYRAMHFSAKRGIAIACLSVRLSVTLVDCDHIGWNTSEIILPLVRLGCSLFADPNIMGLLQGEYPKFGPKVTRHPANLSVGDIR